MSTHKPLSSASELIGYIMELDERGMLNASIVREIQDKLDSISSATRGKINDITNASHQTEWEKFNVTEGFFHHLTPEQWKVFTFYRQNDHRFVSFIEIAEMFFGTENPTSEQLKIAQRHSTTVSIAARHWNKTGELNMKNMMYRGKNTIGYQWRAHESDE